jgi:aminopeptidase N
MTMSDKPQTIYLKDYTRPHYWIRNVDLDVDIYDNETFVLSELTIERNSEYSEKHPLVLDGVDLKLLNIEINNVPLHADQYEVKGEQLIVHTHEENFTLTTKVEIHPEKNLSCEGLYQSGHIYCTQNEAEGFRKITFYQDRPDVMAKFKTIIRADKTKYPILLSNGNKLEEGELENNRHFATWEDPHLKPCYLYALVAGDLGVVKDSYTTSSGRKVALEIYVDKGNEDKCGHAMDSLKNSMKWDEDTFGLEYDLDIYMIVAVDSFNMGAMENKGLNIFNSAYVLAKPETATDTNFQGIEGVIGHEYFHNWTGNRVTCRDWFQLTLKEGLTVFRDQEFSSDMLSRPVKRIDDVKMLREYQFPEDAGPMSHPIRPKSYIEINNFYTATVYEKGSEVIRMYHTLLGKENFRKGMDLYFERHDGQAVTTEDFANAMADASGVNLDQFKAWYDNSGTPRLNISTMFDADKKKYAVTIKQEAKVDNEKYSSLHIPFLFGLIDQNGNDIDLGNNGRIELTKAEETFVYDNIAVEPIPSWNRNFSAPVIVEYDYSDAELAYLMAHDSDEFNRFDAAQSLYKKTIYKLVDDIKAGNSLVLADSFLEAFTKLLDDTAVDEAFLAYALALPSVSELNEPLAVSDYDNIHEARKFMKKSLGEKCQIHFLKRYKDLNAIKEYKLDAKSMGQRALKSVCLSYLAAIGNDEMRSIVKEQFDHATNMTDEAAALIELANVDGELCDYACDKFYQKWKHETLVMQKWLAAQATSSRPGIIERLKKLEQSDVYDPKVPNLLRSLVGGFAMRNPVAFNAKDGSGYQYVADKIIEIDKYNPQVASRLAKSMNHLNKLDKERAGHLKGQLERILASELSKDTYEVVSKNLNG